MKRCGDCGEVKAHTEFHRNIRCQDGLAFYCRACAAIRSERSRRQRGVRVRKAPPKNAPEGMKWCPDCGTVKSVDEFPRHRSARLGRAAYCKPCHSNRGNASRERHGGHRNYHLKRRYGITAAEADAILAEQGGLCAICRTAPAAQVDHNHATGKVRGLLCFNCNGGLGQFRDDVNVMQSAIGYLSDHAGRAVPVSEAASAWPRVIELYPYRGPSIEVEVRTHRRSA